MFGTGFDLHLPFLGHDICAVRDLDAVHMDADRYTFIPTCLAGLRRHVGQSAGSSCRWSYRPGGLHTRGAGWSRRRMGRPAGVHRRVSIAGGVPAENPDEARGVGFARAAGVEPRLDNWPHLRRALCSALLRRAASGWKAPTPLPTPLRGRRDAAAFGAITSNELTEREQKYWSKVTGASPQPKFLDPPAKGRRSDFAPICSPNLWPAGASDAGPTPRRP